MRSLYILRHGTAEWTSPGGDLQRPLQDRGRAEARTVAHYLGEHGEQPELVFCSTATRAEETVETARKEGRWSAEVRFASQLYEAGTGVMKDVIRSAEAHFRRVLVCSHQPTCGILIGELTRTFPPDFPPAAFARIDLELEDWSALRPGMGRLEYIVTPNALR